MITLEPPEVSEPTDLTIEIQSDNGKTMTVHRIKRGGTIRFHNKDKVDPLTITVTDANIKPPPPPFIPPNHPNPVPQFDINPNTHLDVKISTIYDVGDWFQILGQDPRIERGRPDCNH